MLQNTQRLLISENITERTRTFLKNQKIFSVQELIDFFKKHGFSETQHYRNFGKKSGEEIIALFVKYSNLTPLFSIEYLSATTKTRLESAGITTVQALVDFCDKYGVNNLKKYNGIGQKAIDEVNVLLSSELVKQLNGDEKIKKLESDISEYKQAIIRMEAELAELKSKRTTQQKER